jgi:hypothetical protein
MTKAKEFDRAWKLTFLQDTSLVDKIYHSDYRAIDHKWGIEVTIDSDKVIEFTVAKLVNWGPFETIYEDNHFLCIHRYRRILSEKGRKSDHNSIISAVSYKEGKIITQESV